MSKFVIKAQNNAINEIKTLEKRREKYVYKKNNWLISVTDSRINELIYYIGFMEIQDNEKLFTKIYKQMERMFKQGEI